MPEPLERPWLKAQVGDRYSVPRPRVRPLYALLTDSAKLHPKDRCLHYQGRDFTYAEVDDLSSRFASA
ncbi:MAG: hypothetical protein JRN33_06910, partial [Nitrososphaerota archaeon]|nr:hypothetical protein [Nitrososphaerota archaeon]